MTDLQQKWQHYLTELGMEFDTELEDGTTPQQWLSVGMTPAWSNEWRKVGAFDPELAKQLDDADINPEHLAKLVTPEDAEKFGLFYSGYTIGYMYCNGDLSLEQVQRLIES